MESRRGRQLVVNKEQLTKIAGKDNVERYNPSSALNDLDELIAAFTFDRVPQDLVNARNAIRNAKTVEEIAKYQKSPYKIVRDAANDELRIKQGLAPNSGFGTYTFRWGQITQLRVASLQMGPQGLTDSRSERFNLAEHTLSRNPGNLAGTVHSDYGSLRHHLHAQQNWDGIVTRASIERAERSPDMILNDE